MNRYVPQIIMIIFSIILLIIIPYQINVPESTVLNAQLLPKLMGISILVFSSLSLIPWNKFSRQSQTKVTKNEKNSSNKKHYFKVLLTFLSILLWILLAPIIGFILATTSIIFISSLISGYNKKIKATLFSLSSSILLYFVFISLLDVSLPAFPVFF